MKKRPILLLFILLLALSLRTYGLDRVPPELFGDELDVGYQAYSLLRTQKDYYGQFLPVYIHSFSEWRAPLLMYVTVPFVGIFGLNEWGVRLPSVCCGVLSIFFFYLLIKKLSGSETLALLSAFFLTTSPWHIQYSRAAFELSLLLFLFLFGLYLVLESFRKEWLGLLAALFFGLTLYTYSTANVLLPLLLGLVIFVFRKEFLRIKVKIIFTSLAILVLVSIPIGKEIFFGHAAERFSLFSVFGHEEYIQEINLKRIAGGNTLIERIFHNRPLTWLRVIGLNYLGAFSPLFLLERGDVTFRHSIHEMGQIFWIQLPLLLFGIFNLLTIGDKKMRYFWLGWLLLAPIPASLTWDGATHASRLFLMLPPLMVIFSFGVISVFNRFKNKNKKLFFVAAVSFLFILEFSLYLHRFWVHYPVESWRWWHVGYKEAMTFIKENEGNYQKVVINNRHEPALVRFLFWMRYNPEDFQKEFSSDKQEQNILPGFDGFRFFDKYYFGQLQKNDTLPQFIDHKTLYLAFQGEEVPGDWDWGKDTPSGLKVLHQVRTPEGDPYIYLLTKE